MSLKLEVTIPREILNKVCSTILVATLTLIFISSCKDENPVPPKPVPYLCDTMKVGEPLTSLVGTYWKLIAFVDVENDTCRPPAYSVSNPLLEQFYTLCFDSLKVSDTIDISGFGSCNSVNGLCSINYTNSTIQIHPPHYLWNTGIYCEECYDEDNYFLALNDYRKKPNKELKFEASSTKLKIFYNNNKNYLLFRRWAE